MGREADLVIDENPYLHRRFLELRHHDDMWWLANVGKCLTATVGDPGTSLPAPLEPGAQVPVVLPQSVVRFAAGPTAYELTLHLADTTTSVTDEAALNEATPPSAIVLTPDQHLLVVALAEPTLRASGSTPSIDARTVLPSSAATARRLGWPITRFNRKLDYLCHRLERAGVPGLHGDSGRLASGRRARLVRYALATGIVVAEDLSLLDSLAEGTTTACA
jgi:hypothetical protein